MALSCEHFSKEVRFNDLVVSVRHCTLCERLRGRTKVLSWANGNVDSRVLFVAEAPGRLGADRTGVPLCGDQTGRNFETLLGNVGWSRESVFVTNAILCNPRQEDGTNGTPTFEEMVNCASYLEMTIELVDPQVIVTLGLTALSALKLIANHSVELRKGAGRPFAWRKRAVFPLYHPGPRAQVHRSQLKQREDFVRLAKLVDPGRGIRERRRRTPSLEFDLRRPYALMQVLLALVDGLKHLSYFKLTKLLYLVDLLSLERRGHSVTGEVFLRQEEGPWPPKLRGAIAALKEHEVLCYSRRGKPMVTSGPSARFTVTLDAGSLEIIADVLERFGSLDDAAIKTAVYRTAPMKFILKQEKEGRDMRRVAVIYKDRTAIDLDRQGNEPA